MRHSTRTIATIVAALALVAAGAALIAAPLSVHGITRVAGLGLALGAVLAFIAAGRPSGQHPRLFPRSAAHIAAAAVGVAGLAIAAWPTAGAPWLAFAVAIAVIAHGLATAAAALWRTGASRMSGLIAAAASILLGAVALSWPVLTLSMFRLAIGAWLIFTGLRALGGLWAARSGSKPRSPSARAATAGQGRGWLRLVGALCALALAVGVAAGSGFLLGGAPRAHPDAFYTPPAQLSSEAGELLRSEPLTAGVPAGARAWKILYTTTDAHGEPIVASGTVLAPTAAGAAELPVVSVAHGTTGVAAQCAPSLSATPFGDGAGAALAEIVATHGWAAVTSDYVGLGTAGTHAYLVGEVGARNVLDASVAARQLARATPGAPKLSQRTVVWGHSQGGQVALWAGQLAPEYAAELEVLGVAAFAPAADLFGLANATKSDATGKTVSAYIASTWNELYPELELAANMTPGSARGVNRIAQLCFNGQDVLGAILTGGQVPNQVFPDSLLDGPFGIRLRAQTPTGPFAFPVLVAQGTADPLVKPELQAEWTAARCEAGVPIDYREFDGLDHLSLVAAASPLTSVIIEWTLDRESGVPADPAQSCA